jgi:hypothetical protein
VRWNRDFFAALWLCWNRELPLQRCFVPETTPCCTEERVDAVRSAA